ncbi:MAG TPA: histidine ammonia-lyase [Firmicutes bacterium]|nr:histidine ammonia-lyase [Bacillota bacterium]
MAAVLALNGHSLRLEDVVEVARGSVQVEISEEALAKVRATREVIEKYVRGGLPVYGVNTGFGALCDTSIPAGALRRLQRNLVRSHASGAGGFFPREIVRAAMLLRANSLSRGQSGVRPIVVETLVKMLNKDVTPAVHSEGSLGASGDLAPLADLALVVTGGGRAWYRGELLDGREAMERAGILPIELEAKEGLALLNGTAFMTAMAVLACDKAVRYLEAQNAAAALSLAGFAGTAVPYTERLIKARAHEGALIVARHMRRLLEGNRMVESGKRRKVQDPYCFRCVPQVHGAAVTALLHTASVIEVEINSATDNPLIIDGNVYSGGNFHGQPVGSVMDYLTIAITSVAAMAERRVNQLLHPGQSGLPAFLTPDPGLNSGLMIAQYTAASLVNESRVLATPASIHSIPVCADQEDHISMATYAAHKALEVMGKVTLVSAIELLTAAQAVDLRLVGQKPSEVLGDALSSVYETTRQRVPFVAEDESLAEHIESMASAIEGGELHEALKRKEANLDLENTSYRGDALG